MLLIAGGTVVGAGEFLSTNHLANFDVRRGAPRGLAPLAPEQVSAQERIHAAVPDLQPIEWDDVLGTPRWIHRREGFLTGPQGEGRAVAAKTVRALPADDPDRPIKAFLEENRALFGHGPEALLSAEKKRDYVTAHNGLRTVAWEQHVEGLPVRGAMFMAHLTRLGEVACVSGGLLPDAVRAADRGTPKRARLLAGALLAPQEAVRRAAVNLGEPLDHEVCRLLEGPTGPARGHRFKAGHLPGEATAQLVWLPLGRQQLRLCWETVATRPYRGETFRVWVDAETGQTLVRHGLTFDVSEATYRVYTSDSPSPFSPAYPTPTTMQPPFVDRTLLTFSSLSTNASPLGWIANGDNGTRGNNVDAYLDRNADNQPDLPRLQGSPFRVFDFPLDLSQDPASYGEASTVQLFYWCNYIHDRVYDLGFTEAAGNYQKDNLGRGGAGNDAVLAEAQDGSGVNNANFTPMPDGIPGRMQMFIFDGPTPRRDGSLDAEVVLHEYTHGISDRLVGGGAGITQLQTSGMAEGWSDFLALTLLAESGDDVDGSYAYGGYVTYLYRNLRQNYYYGIRAYPYSTDLTKNPVTFKDIDPAQASPHAEVLMNPTVTALGSEVHFQGHVWCMMLWEARANLIHRLGFADGNDRILRLVLDGMKLSPPNPTWVQARDAILAADMIGFQGEDRADLWAAFAKRGLGYSAQAPDVTTTSGIVEAMDLPDALTVTPETPVVMSGTQGGPFSPSNQTYIVSNQRGTTTQWGLWVAFTNGDRWLDVQPLRGIVSDSETNLVTAQLTATAQSLPAGNYTVSLVFTNLQTRRLLTRVVSLQVIQAGHAEFFTQQFTRDNFNLTNTTLTFTPDASNAAYTVCQTAANTFPTEPMGGIPVALWDDSYMRVTLTNGAAVSLFGRATNSVLIGSNGDVAYEVPGTYTNAGPGFYAFYCEPFLWFIWEKMRVSPFYADFNPEMGGAISYKQLPDRLAVTWQNLPEYGKTNSNNFQVELFFDGTIRLTYLRMDALNAILGLSPGGGVPTGYLDDLFSVKPFCGPSLRLDLPIRITEGTTGLQGAVTLNQTVVGSDLVIPLQSSDPNSLIVPDSVVVSNGLKSATFPLGAPDDALWNGTRYVTVTAALSDLQKTSAQVAVDDNEVASLLLNTPAHARQSDGVLTNRGWLGMDRVPDADITVELTSLNPDLVLVPPTVVIPQGQTSARFDLLIVTNQYLEGPQVAVVVAHVENWLDDLDAIQVDDDKPRALSVSLPAAVDENAGLIRGAGKVRLSGLLTSNLTVQLTCDRPDLLILSNTATVPAGQWEGSFDLLPVNNNTLDGPRSVSVTATAPGFTSGTDQVTINDDEMPSAPIQPGPADLAVGVGTLTNLTWSTLRAEPPGTVIYDVYFGTNALLTQADYAGSAVDSVWGLPPLSLATRYYWQVSVSKQGQTVTGPVWQFTTAGLGGFAWGALGVAQPVGVPFPASLTAQDPYGVPVGDFAGSVRVSGLAQQPTRSTLVIAEVDTSAKAATEFVNVTDHAVDVSGWQIVYYDWMNWPEPLFLFTIPARSVSQPGEVFVLKKRSQQTAPGIYPAFCFSMLTGWDNNPNNNPVAVMLRDDLGNLVDFFCAVDADPSAIQHPNSIPPEFWRGASVPANLVSTRTYQRVGNTQHHDATDWRTALSSLATNNAGLTLPFADQRSVSLSPDTLTPFVNGVWSGPMTVSNEAHGLVLHASDGQGHEGFSAPLDIVVSNQVLLTLQTTPARPVLGGLAWHILVLSNTGPAAATGVRLVGDLALGLPAAVVLGSVNVSQGTWSNAGNQVVCDLGSLAGGARAVVQLSFVPQTNQWLTNQFSVTRFEPQANSAHNLVAWTDFVRSPYIWTTNAWVGIRSSNPTNISFPVWLSQASVFPVSINGATADGSAVAGVDYLAVNQTLTFAPGTTNLSLTVPVTGGTIYGTNKLFSLNLSQPVNAALLVGSVFGGITNNQSPPGFRITDASVQEGDSGLTNMVFTVYLSAVSGKPIWVNYASADDSARAGVDYLPVGGLLVFPPGTTNQTVQVPVVGDRIYQGNRRFFVKLSAATDAFIWVSQGAGTIVDDDGAQLHHFDWGVPAPTQQVNVPFQIELTARDASNQRVASYDGPVVFRARRAPQDITVGSGSSTWENPLGASFHDDRVEALYWAQEIGRAGRITALALGVTTLPGQVLSNWTIRLQPTTLTGLQYAGWETNGWTVVYQGDLVLRTNGWVTFPFQQPFDYDGTNHLLVDFSFRNASYTTDGLVLATRTNQVRVLSFRTDSGFGDPLSWSGTVPAPIRTSLLPNLRFSFETPVHVQPVTIGPFVNGVWSGDLTVLEPALQMTLYAADSTGPSGISAPVNVIYWDSDGDGLPDWWELAHGLNPKDPSDAGEDPDQDGMTNLQEYLAGTDPQSAASVLRISSLAAVPGGVRFEFPTVAGKQYLVEGSVKLVPGSWTPASGLITGTGASVVVTNQAAGSFGRFYRVRVVMQP